MIADLLIYISLFCIWLMLFYHAFLMFGGYFHSLKHHKFTQKFDKIEHYPKVSILVPAHNEEVVIEDTIKAMIQLDYPKEHLEVIIINDNSSDQTGSIIEQYAKDYSFIKAVHTRPPQAGKGKSGALNQGLKQATGEFIDRKSTRLNSSHVAISYAVFCLKTKNTIGCQPQQGKTDSLMK